MNLELDPQWLAGFFDGEGCVSASCNKRQRMPNIQVNITQSDLTIISAIQAMFPDGNIVKIHAPFGRRACYQVQWYGKRAIPFLEAIAPFVVVKRIQVLAALDSLRITPSSGHRSSEELVNRRISLGKEIKAANNKEIVDGTATYTAT